MNNVEGTGTLSLLSAVLVAAALSATGCTGSPDVVATGDEPPSNSTDPLAKDRPSGGWYYGHTQSQGHDGYAFLADAVTHQPISGARLCTVGSDGDGCTTSGSTGLAPVLGEGPGNALLVVAHPDFAESTMTIDMPGDGGVRAFGLLSSTRLSELHAAAGVERDLSRGVVVAGTDGPGGLPEGVTVTLTAGGETFRAAYAGSDGDVVPSYVTTTTAGVAYFFNVPEGSGYELTFGGTGVSCSVVPGSGWPGSSGNVAETRVTGGSVVYAGTATCASAAE